MNHQLRTDIDKLIDLCEATSSSGAELIKQELLNYISYLSSSDGVIAEEEATFIRQYLQTDLSPAELSQYIEKNNTYSTEFETTVPETFCQFIEKDNSEFNKNGALRYSFSLAYVNVMEQAGKEFLVCDGNATESEVADYNTYISMLKKHRNQVYRADASAKSALLEGEVAEEPAKTEESHDENNFDALMEQLNQLVGLESVKNDVTALIHLQEIQRIRKERGLKQLPVSKHLVFYGNPGTGKTTVARLLAEIYHAMGMLSKGTIVEVDRSGLVGGYVGQTALKTKEVIDRAIGGVLFVDEAYSLAYSDFGNDYGREAIDTLLKGMEDNRDNLVVIVAGYPDLMQKFIDSNPGLRSRFNKYIFFEDYHPDELVEIFKVLCEKSGYSIDDNALGLVSELLEERYNNKSTNFANGREVRNIFEKIVLNQADRLFGKEDVSDEELSRIISSDIKVQ